jgi:hypothetical protein
LPLCHCFLQRRDRQACRQRAVQCPSDNSAREGIAPPPCGRIPADTVPPYVLPPAVSFPCKVSQFPLSQFMGLVQQQISTGFNNIQHKPTDRNIVNTFQQKSTAVNTFGTRRRYATGSAKLVAEHKVNGFRAFSELALRLFVFSIIRRVAFSTLRIPLRLHPASGAFSHRFSRPDQGFCTCSVRKGLWESLSI